MVNRYLRIAMLIGMGLAATGVQTSLFARSPDSGARLQAILAIEEAGSPFGRYRVVFTLTAPLPRPSNMYLGQMFHLGDQRVTVPGDTRDRTVMFGYFASVPSGIVTFKMTERYPPARVETSGSEGVGAEEIAVDAQVLLASSRPAHGEYEAPHIRRSEQEEEDIWSTWVESDVVFVGSFVREDAEPQQKGAWRLHFKTDELLRSPTGQALPEIVVFRAQTLPHRYELGGRYLLFVGFDRAKQRVSDDLHGTVRLWWPSKDFVLEFIQARRKFGQLAGADDAVKRSVRDFLVNELENPAREVRLTAARELLGLSDVGFHLSADEVDSIANRLEREPSPTVKQALRDLLDAKVAE